MATKRYKLEELFPERAPRYAAPHRGLERLPQAKTEAAQLKLLELMPNDEEIQVAVPGLGEQPAKLFVTAGALGRLCFPKTKTSKPPDGLLPALETWLSNRWGPRLHGVKQARWLAPEARLRADLYGSRVDGVFLDVMPYTPYLAELQRLVDAAQGKPADIPWPGMSRAQVAKLPGFELEPGGARAFRRLGFTEYASVESSWTADLERGEVTAVQLYSRFFAASTTALVLAKPMLKGLPVAKAPFGLELATKVPGLKVVLRKDGQAWSQKA